MPQSEVFNIDCMKYMRSVPDNHFALAIVDPPYGLSKKSTQGAGKLKNRTLNRSTIQQWDVRPGKEYFDELFRISENQIIWGGNYFELPPTRCFVCWDKQQVWENFSQCELAWTSFDKPAKHITISNRGAHIDHVHWHPTAKPVELYAYLLRTFAVGGGKIFDSHLGSGSSRIASYKMGFDFVGCEIDPTYFQLGEERFQHECMGVQTVTESGNKIIQGSLF